MVKYGRVEAPVCFFEQHPYMTLASGGSFPAWFLHVCFLMFPLNPTQYLCVSLSPFSSHSCKHIV